jgi:hypothetical protein
MINLFPGPIFSLPLLYLDPGSGSFLIQLLLAAALGAGVAVRMYWVKIKSFFKGKKGEQEDPLADDNSDEE